MIPPFLQELITLLLVVDPVAGAALFAALTAGRERGVKRAMARRSALAVGGVLLLFLLAGQAIFQLFSVTMAAFRIAGGIVVGITALDLLGATATRVRSVTAEGEGTPEHPDPAITPVAIPMLAGPGAISTVMILGSGGTGAVDGIRLVGVILMVSLTVWGFLNRAGHLVERLGTGGLTVVNRLLGLMVMTIAVQFVVDGVVEAIPGWKGEP